MPLDRMIEQPEDYVSERLADGTRWTLPRRRLGAFRFVGLIFFLFGLFMIAFGVGWITSLMRQASENSGGMQWGLTAFALIGLLPIFGSFLPIGMGFAVLAGRCEIEIDHRRLRVIERGGPFYWSWSRPIDQLRRFEIARGTVTHDGEKVTTGPLAKLAGIKAEFDNQRPLMLALGYPHELVTRLADELAAVSDRSTGETLLKRDNVEVVEVTGDDDRAFTTPLPQPEGSRAELDERADGLTIVLPPLGVRKGSHGLIYFALAWLGFMALFTSAIVFGEKSDDWVIGLGFSGIFWLIGLVMLLISVNLGRRRAIIDVVGDTLLVSRQSLFGTKQQEWRAADLARVHVGASGTEINNRPVLELKVQPNEGKTIGMMGERGDDELRWIASRLNQALGLPRPD